MPTAAKRRAALVRTVLSFCIAVTGLIFVDADIADARQYEADDIEDQVNATSVRGWRAVGLAVGVPLVASVALMPTLHLAGPIAGSSTAGIAYASIGELDRGLAYALTFPMVIALGLTIGNAWDESRPQYGEHGRVSIGEGKVLGIVGTYVACTAFAAVDVFHRAYVTPARVTIPGFVPVGAPSPSATPEGN